MWKYDDTCASDLYFIAYNSRNKHGTTGDKMIRLWRFAIWLSMEFELVSYQRQYHLQSENSLDLKNGSMEKNGDRHVFIKPISVKELENAYEIILYAMIIGYRFAVEEYNKKTGNVVLVTNNPFVKKKIDVRT